MNPSWIPGSFKTNASKDDPTIEAESKITEALCETLASPCLISWFWST